MRAALACAALACASGALAGTCEQTHVVAAGESLSVIAERYLGSAAAWEAIHEENRDMLGASPDTLRVGMRLRLPCPRAGGDAAETPVPAAAAERVDLLTAPGFAPFADRDLPGGGMLTELVEAAFGAAPDAGEVALHWVEDRAAHLSPLLETGRYDLGFPWPRPDCEADPDEPLCAELIFSAPMFEALVLLFVDAARPIAFTKDADMRDRVLCQPEGFPDYFFDMDGRDWLRKERITLRTPESAAACFDLLMAGEVDGVVLDEFAGRHEVAELGLGDRVAEAEGQPVAIVTYHVVAHKAHPQGALHLRRFDEGLAALRAEGRFREIVGRHLARVWAERRP
ncbi:LysM peptidoglycan-binding domain-containing protein [Roseovarius sp. SCSIO 43702]|nr:LysM peptidoglycan-binding domain-containing protein [Roseovarius sp. SCSIO 43702]